MQIVDLHPSYYDTKGQHVPSADLVEKHRPGVFEIIEVDAVVDMQVAVDVRESDLEWNGKRKAASQLSRGYACFQRIISDLLVFSSILRIEGLYPIISTTESKAIQAREMLSSLICKGSLISASNRYLTSK